MNEFQSDRDGETSREEALQPWVAPRLIPLDRISKTEKLSWNTEHGMISGLSS